MKKLPLLLISLAILGGSLLFTACNSDNSLEAKISFHPIRLLERDGFLNSYSQNKIAILAGQKLKAPLQSWSLLEGTTSGYHYLITQLPNNFEPSLASLDPEKTPLFVLNGAQVKYADSVAALKAEAESCWTISKPLTINARIDVKPGQRTLVELPSEFTGAHVVMNFDKFGEGRKLRVFDTEGRMLTEVQGEKAATESYFISGNFRAMNGTIKLFLELINPEGTKGPIAMESVTIGQEGRIILKQFIDGPPKIDSANLEYNATHPLLRKHIEVLKKSKDYDLHRYGNGLIKTSLQNLRHDTLITQRSLHMLPTSRFSDVITMPDKPVLDFYFAKTRMVNSDLSVLNVEFRDLDDPKNTYVKTIPMKARHSQEWYQDRITLDDFSGKKVEVKFFLSVPERRIMADSDQGLILGEPIITSAAGRETESKPNVIFISLDTFRNDRRSASGYARLTTPYMDEIAKKGINFRRAYSQVTWTLPSHSSMLSGYHPLSFAHATTNSENLIPISKDLKIISTYAKENGYRTAAFTGATYLSNVWGFYKEFDTYGEYYSYSNSQTEKGTRVVKPIEWTTAYEFLEDNKDTGPFFLMLHTYMPHTPYTGYGYDEYFNEEELQTTLPMDIEEKVLHKRRGTFTEDDVKHVNNVYDRGVRRTDDELKRLFGELERLQLIDNTIVVIVSDHGEMLGERDIVGQHGPGWEVGIRVPMIFYFPKAFKQGVEITERVELMDIMPTMASIFGSEIPADFYGRNLLPVLKSGKMPKDEEHLTVGSEMREDLSFIVAHQGKYKLHMHEGGLMLSNLETNPDELEFMDHQAGEGKEIADKLIDRAFYAFAQQFPGWKVWIKNDNPDITFSLESEVNFYRQVNATRVRGYGNHTVYFNARDLSDIKGNALILLGKGPEDEIPLRLVARNNKTGEVVEARNICFGFRDQPFSSPFANIAGRQDMQTPSWREGVPQNLLDKYKIFIWSSQYAHQEGNSNLSLELDSEMQQQLRDLGYLN